MSVRTIALAFMLIPIAVAGIVIFSVVSDPAAWPRHEQLPMSLAFVVGFMAATFGSPHLELGATQAVSVLTVTHVTGPPVAVGVCVIVVLFFAVCVLRSIREVAPVIPIGTALASIACFIGGVSLIAANAPTSAPPAMVFGGLVLSVVGAVLLKMVARGIRMG